MYQLHKIFFKKWCVLSPILYIQDNIGKRGNEYCVKSDSEQHVTVNILTIKLLSVWMWKQVELSSSCRQKLGLRQKVFLIGCSSLLKWTAHVLWIITDELITLMSCLKARGVKSVCKRAMLMKYINHPHPLLSWRVQSVKCNCVFSPSGGFTRKWLWHIVVNNTVEFLWTKETNSLWPDFFYIYNWWRTEELLFKSTQAASVFWFYYKSQVHLSEMRKKYMI